MEHKQLADWIKAKVPEWRDKLDVCDGTDEVYEYLLGAECGYYPDQAIAVSLMLDALGEMKGKFPHLWKIYDGTWWCDTGVDNFTRYDSRYAAARAACEFVASNPAK